MDKLNASSRLHGVGVSLPPGSYALVQLGPAGRLRMYRWQRKRS